MEWDVAAFDDGTAWDAAVLDDGTDWDAATLNDGAAGGLGGASILSLFSGRPSSLGISAECCRAPALGEVTGEEVLTTTAVGEVETGTKGRARASPADVRAFAARSPNT